MFKIKGIKNFFKNSKSILIISIFLIVILIGITAGIYLHFSKSNLIKSSINIKPEINASKESGDKESFFSHKTKDKDISSNGVKGLQEKEDIEPISADVSDLKNDKQENEASKKTVETKANVKTPKENVKKERVKRVRIKTDIVNKIAEHRVFTESIFKNNALSPFTGNTNIIEGFAEPILYSLYNNDPTYTDRFIVNKGWRFDSYHGSGNYTEHLKVEDNKMKIFAGGIKGNTLWTPVSNSKVFAKNFVLKTDVSLEPDNGSVALIFFFDKSFEPSYRINIDQSGLKFMKIARNNDEIYKIPGDISLLDFQLTIIVSGNNIAVYLDDYPALFYYNKGGSHGSDILFTASTKSKSSLQIVTYKNLEFWDLDRK